MTSPFTGQCLARKLISVSFMIGAVLLLRANGHGSDWTITENAAYLCLGISGRLWMTW